MAAANEHICPYCDELIIDENDAVFCPQCNAVHHRKCWEDENGCGTSDCDEKIFSPFPLYNYEKSSETSVEDRLNHLTPKNEDRQTLYIIGGVILAMTLVGILASYLGVNTNTIIVLAVIISAMTFDYVNGMHDAGNAIATVISTRVLSPAAALTMAAVLNLLGALLFSEVAKNIATKFANMDQLKVLHLSISPMMILCGLIGASAWSFYTARIGMPVSTSHSLFGGLIGVFLVSGIPLNMVYMGKLGMWMVLAPLIAFSVGWALMLLVNFIFRNVAPWKLNKHFRGWQLLSSATMAFAHGSNDAQKAMGIITMALVAGNFQSSEDHSIHLWVKVACAAVIALGTGFGGMKVIQTLGHKIIKLAPVHGFVAETVAGATIQLVTHLGVPISTTHVISSSILGIGASRRLSAVRWGVAGNIVIAWIFTIPTCALIAALLYKLVVFVTPLR
ncbi:MAG: inorganic phosphate transporter [bacterium]